MKSETNRKKKWGMFEANEKCSKLQNRQTNSNISRELESEKWNETAEKERKECRGEIKKWEKPFREKRGSKV